MIRRLGKSNSENPAKKPNLKERKLPTEKKAISQKEQERLNDKLITLAWNGSDIGIKRLVKKGADIAANADNRGTALHRAASHGRIETCKLLIEEYAKLGGNVKELTNAKQNDGWTPLHCAAVNGHAQVSLVLLDNGADISSRTNDGSTAFSMAKAGSYMGAAEAIRLYAIWKMLGRDEGFKWDSTFHECISQ